MSLKTPDQRALPKPNPRLDREAAWATVIENDGLVKFVLNRFVERIMAAHTDYFGYSRDAMFEELLSTAYEAALVAVETFEPEKGFALSTYAEKVIWRDLTDELVRWRSNTGHQDGDLSIEELMIPLHPQAAPSSSDQYDPHVNEVLEATSVDPFERIDEQLDAKAAAGTVRAALSAREFKVLQLTADGYEPREIGKKLGITGGNARVILHRARDKAQAALA